MNDEQQALPGFADLISQIKDRGGENDLTAPHYTAATVLRDYPGTFAAVARAIFKYNLPNRVVRDLFHMNGETVRGIQETVMSAVATDARGAFLTKCRAASSRNIVQCRLIDTIMQKLDDPEVVKKMDVTELTNILLALDPKEDAAKPTGIGTPKDITIYEGDSFDAVIDGLAGGKKRALEARPDSEKLEKKVP